jgi:hypothetical protein
MNKPTYKDKIELLDRYIQHPQSVHDPEVLRSIKTDVVKAHSKPAKTGAKQRDGGAEAGVLEDENSLYNTAMGLYREFVTARGSYLDMSGKKGPIYSKAMRDIINYLRGFMKNNNKPHQDDNVVEALTFMFANWDRLNDYLKGRIQLPQIHDNIAEILLKIRNGANQKTASKDSLEQFKRSLTNG